MQRAGFFGGLLVASVITAAGAEPLRLAQAAPQAAPPAAPRAAQPRPAAPQPAAPQPAAPQAPPAAPAQAEAPPQPTRVETVRHDGWSLTCQDFAEGRTRRVCRGLIQVGQPNTNQVLLSWILAPGDDGRIVNVIQTLPGVSIGPGIEMKVGKGAARKIAFATCAPTHCTGTLVADDAFLRDAAAAETAEALVVGSNGRAVQFNINAKGLDKVLAALRR